MAEHKHNDDTVLMTQEGYDKLSTELKQLRSEERYKIARRIEEARSFGDLSEDPSHGLPSFTRQNHRFGLLVQFARFGWNDRDHHGYHPQQGVRLLHCQLGRIRPGKGAYFFREPRRAGPDEQTSGRRSARQGPDGNPQAQDPQDQSQIVPAAKFFADRNAKTLRGSA